MIQYDDNITLIIISSAFILLLFVWLIFRSNKIQKKLKKEKFKYDIKKDESYKSLEEKDRLFYRKLEATRLRHDIENSFQQKTGLGSGGFLMINCSNDKKSLFHDLLKGFEEYTQLIGYNVSLSIDNSILNKIAFKYSLTDVGLTMPVQKIKKDFFKYISYLQKDASFSDLPEISASKQYTAIMQALKSRIKFLQHHYKLKEKTTRYYNNMLKKFYFFSAGIIQAASIYSNPEINLNSSDSELTDSFDTAENNKIESSEKPADITTESVDSSDILNVSVDSSDILNVSVDSSDTKDEKIDGLSKLIELLKNDEKVDVTDKYKIIMGLEVIKTDLTENREPEKSKIEKWFVETREFLGDIEVDDLSVDKAQDIYDTLVINQTSNVLPLAF